MTKKIMILILFLGNIGIFQAQTITGRIINDERQPIEGATIVMQTIDSIYIDATISDTEGTFVLNGQPNEYRLIVQHLLFQTKHIVSNKQDIGVIQLIPQDYALAEIIVKAERPYVKAENGRLTYNLSLLPGNRTTNNAYEAITKLPGVQPNRGSLTLAGTEKLTILLNGKPTTMDAGQIENLLRNTPTDRVEKAEVMYSAPPEYHVKGAVINIVLKRPDDYSFQGEINADYKNQYFNSGEMNANFHYSTPKIALVVVYSANNVHNMEYMNLYSRHALAEQVYPIEQNEQLRSKYWKHSLQTSFAYNFSDKSHISISYTGDYIPDQHNNSRTTGNFQTGNVDKYVDSRMHNITLQYQSAFGLNIGGDYTYYRSDNNQHLHTLFQSGEQNGFDMVSGQKINRYSIYADQKHPLAKGWNMGYGASFRLAKDYDYQTYNQVTGDLITQDIQSDLTEQTTNFYLSIGKNTQTGVSFSLSATGEFYTIGNYRQWAVYPQASFTYSLNPKHTFQLSLSTDKTYPGYWAMQSSVNHLNGYTELHGTSGLKPMTTYSLNGNYILRQKYIFGLFFLHSTDYFAQTAYQSTERLALIYKYTNWNYMQLAGANIILPFKAGNWLDSHLTLTGMQMRQQCDKFFDIPFNRKQWTFNAMLDNTFKIKQNLFFELMGHIQTPAIQGTFDIETFYNLTAGIKWNIAKDKISLSLRCNDIFNTGNPNLKVRFKGQYLDMDNAYYSRAFNIHLTYRFGGYKKRETKSVDTSRFGH